MSSKRTTQYERVLKHLQDFGKITSWEGFTRYGVTRLSAIIYTMRKNGYDITSKFKTTKNRYGYYVTFAEYTIR